jgi:hypothetical protein
VRAGGFGLIILWTTRKAIDRVQVPNNTTHGKKHEKMVLRRRRSNRRLSLKAVTQPHPTEMVCDAPDKRWGLDIMNMS